MALPLFSSKKSHFPQPITSKKPSSNTKNALKTLPLSFVNLPSLIAILLFFNTFTPTLTLVKSFSWLRLAQSLTL